jgi:hypothetical protein
MNFPNYHKHKGLGAQSSFPNMVPELSWISLDWFQFVLGAYLRLHFMMMPVRMS